MPHLQPITLAFPQGLHLGTRAVTLEEAGVHIPSDTLFSALVDIWGRTGGDPDAWSRPFRNGDPPFLLTSAFPFAGDARFFPMPVDPERLMPANRTEESATINKRLKRIHFLSEGLLRCVLGGHGLPDDLFSADEKSDAPSAVTLQEDALCLLPEEVDKLPTNDQDGQCLPRLLQHQDVWRQARVPRVTVDRINSASNIFHAGRTRFAPGCGLWFGVQWRNPDMPVADQTGLSYRDALAKSLALLGEEGIGGERSAGYGAFVPTWGKKFHLRDPRPGHIAWLLSRYLPAPAELPACLNDAHAAYQLVRIGGWARSLYGADQRRKQINFLAEGSLMAWPSAAVVGAIADLRPAYAASAGEFPHPIWRSGLALAVGLKSRREGH